MTNSADSLEGEQDRSPPTIDWSGDAENRDSPLALPTCIDDLETTVSRMRNLRRVVENGKSLAVATHWAFAIDEGKANKRWICADLTVAEYTQVVAWSKGQPPPRIDWSWLESHKSVCHDLVAAQGYAAMVDALNKLYPFQYPKLSRHNVAWFALNKPDQLPLLSGVTKMLQKPLSQLEFPRKKPLWIQREVAEVQTARQAVRAATANLKQAQRRLPELAESLERSTRILNNREEELGGERLVPRRKETKMKEDIREEESIWDENDLKAGKQGVAKAMRSRKEG